jgi:hypothetical protein
MDELADAWNELHEATPAGWHVGRPAYEERRNEWSLYAFYTRERPKVGRRAHEWTAISPTQSGVLREMARCLRVLSRGGVPK